MRWSRVMYYAVFAVLLLTFNLNVHSMDFRNCAGIQGDGEKCLKHILTVLRGVSGKSIQNELYNRNSETDSTDRKMAYTGKTFDRIAETMTNLWDFTRDLLDIRDSKITLNDDDLRRQEITRANRHFRRFLLSFLIGVMLKLGAFFPVVVAGLFLLGNTAFVFGKTALFLSGLIAFLRYYFYFQSQAAHAHELPHQNERLDYFGRFNHFTPRYHPPEYYYHNYKYKE